MPHCIIEFSDELDVKPLMAAVHQGTLASGLFTEEDIKVRAMPYSFHYANAEHKHFVHVTTKILSGRTNEQQTFLSQCVLKELEKLVLPSVSITVEVCDIERTSYSKIVVS